MNIRDVFNKLSAENEAAFVPYLTAGFPDMKSFMKNLETVCKSGADIVEVGYPFSDPVADGPTIQHSSQVALEKGITLKSVLSELSTQTLEKPLVLMSYLNPVVAYGESIWQDLKKAGFAGIIIPDMPLEEATGWCERAEKEGISLVLLVTPVSPDERIKKITDSSRGFIYCVSISGTTGTRDTLPEDLLDFVKRVKSVTQTPVSVGFGISTPEQAGHVSTVADGVIVGSRIIRAVDNNEDIGSLVRDFKNATRR